MFSLITKYQILECLFVEVTGTSFIALLLCWSQNILIDQLGLGLGWLAGNL